MSIGHSVWSEAATVRITSNYIDIITSDDSRVQFIKYTSANVR